MIGVAAGGTRGADDPLYETLERATEFYKKLLHSSEGAPALDGRKPTYLILDGQQRLTSLYQAFFGKGDQVVVYALPASR